MANSGGDANCVSGYYCDGMSGGNCQAQKANGMGCGRSGECLSGNCNGTNHCQ
jgi:hypothetical protein